MLQAQLVLIAIAMLIYSQWTVWYYWILLGSWVIYYLMPVFWHLCLSTGGIAMTVNILTGLSYEMIPVIGIILAPIIFIGGHIANLAFQSLGAFINSLRLHYVEFFAQFYMGGKIRFEAFRAERSFTKIRR